MGKDDLQHRTEVAIDQLRDLFVSLFAQGAHALRHGCETTDIGEEQGPVQKFTAHPGDVGQRQRPEQLHQITRQIGDDHVQQIGQMPQDRSGIHGESVSLLVVGRQVWMEAVVFLRRETGVEVHVSTRRLSISATIDFSRHFH